MPSALRYGFMPGNRISGQRKDRPKGQFRHRLRVGSGGRGHRKTRLRGGIDVNRIQTNAMFQNALEMRRSSYRRRIDWR